MKKSTLEFIYSIAILIAIPALLIINTFLLVSNTRQNYNQELQRKADLINLAIANSSLLYLENNDTDQLSNFLSKLDTQSKTISNLHIAKINQNDVIVVASSNDLNAELRPFQKQHVKLAADVKENPIARLDDAFDENGNKTKAWTIATPIIDDENNVVAVALSSTATTDADELISNTYKTSFVVLAISVIAVVGLMLHHYRLAGYSKLLAKQKEINQTMSDFLSVATHELKAPSSIIKGYISNVLDGTFGDIQDKVRQQLTVAVAQTDRLNNLLQDLLNVSRIEQGRIEYKIEQVDVQSIVQTIVNTYQDKAKGKNLALKYEIESQQPKVIADAGRIQEIFTNLIDNGVKYTASGSVIISHSTDGKFLVTKVRDTGHGINAEERSRLFQRFYRIQNEHTKNISGTGLGLWIIKQYIEAMRGKIEVDSLVGSGTEFSVYLRLANEKTN